MRPIILCALGAASLVALASPALAQHQQTQAWPEARPGDAKLTAIKFKDPGEAKFANDPHTRAFYELAVRAFANGPDKVDVDGFEKESYQIFREMAVSWGMNPDGMQDHLKLIPRQVVKIAREDPKALASYDAFLLALLGPPD